jgi:hypothetical protein
MNENTEKLIRELAEKLGTTTEHIWSVLVAQAPISSSINLAILIGFAVAVYASYKQVARKAISGGEWDDNCGSMIFPWIAWVAFAFLAIFVACCSIEDIAAGLLNPEYWALKQIIK